MIQKKISRLFYRKKNAFSLIEIIIAFSLAGILFGCIFSNFYQTRQLQTQVEKAHAVALNRQMMQLHLRTLFAQLPSALQDDEKTEECDSPLYVADFGSRNMRALWFSSVAEYSSDRRFIGPLNHSLYLDEKNHALQLMTRNQKGVEKVEELMHHVHAWDFQLFDPEKKTWTDVWPKNADYLPSLLKIRIFEQGRKPSKEAVEFGFALPAASQVLVVKAGP